MLKAATLLLLLAACVWAAPKSDVKPNPKIQDLHKVAMPSGPVQTHVVEEPKGKVVPPAIIGAQLDEDWEGTDFNIFTTLK
jgi:hypothetical protein